MPFRESKSGQFLVRHSKRAGASFWESIADMFKVFLQYAKRHPVWGGIWAAYFFWVNTLAFHHIKDAVQLTKDFSEIVKALSPF